LQEFVENTDKQMTERIQRSWTKHDSALNEGTAKAAWIRMQKKLRKGEATSWLMNKHRMPNTER
jgi:hypothetical protein